MQEQTQTQSLSTDKFLTISINLLNKAFLEASRTDAKRVYRSIEDGKTVPLTHLEMEDKSRVRFDLALDHTQYQGKLSYSSFRTGLTLLIARIADMLRAGEEFRTLQNEQNPRSVMFAVPVATTENDRPSVLVLGAESRSGEASLLLNLCYLDPTQFEAEQARSAADGSDVAAVQPADNALPEEDAAQQPEDKA